VASLIVKGITPHKMLDVQGAMIGADVVDWASSGSRILPGAICEHFTSFGGMMVPNVQTPLTEFLRHGAAGASGTVVEPYALQDKFPVPMIHAHYAGGCTLAEAFYQSVFGPYQLLIVGDPLCRPWAVIPQVTVEGARSGATVKGTLVLRPSATIAGSAKVARFELFVDGRRIAKRAPGETFELDTTTLVDGHHELRIVAIDATPIETQGRAIIPIMVDNRSRTCELATSAINKTRWGQNLVLRVDAPGAAQFSILDQAGRSLYTAGGEQGRVTIDPRRLGQGPVTIHAVAFDKADNETDGKPVVRAIARPLRLLVEPAKD
jgi:hypothetical protein